MRIFAQKQNRPHKQVSSSFARSNTANGPNHLADLILHLQRTIGNQASLRMLQTRAEEPEVGLTGTASPRFGHDFSQIPIHSPAAGAIETKLAINKPGDEYEQEADTPPIVQDLLTSPGQPLDPTTSAFFEPRFGFNFSQVRIHADEQSAGAAQAVGAHAFALGTHVVFGKDKYTPSSLAGRELLAHELAHVVQQQATGRRAIARQPVEQYEERGQRLTRESLEKAAKASYWFVLIQETYEIELRTGRLHSDAEERDAVLSVLWQVRPKGRVEKETKQVVTIPKRAAAGSKTLLYEFTFRPKDKNDPKAKDKVNIEFIAEGPGVVETSQPKASYRPSVSSYSHEGFPADILGYWKAHPDEEKQLFHWIEKLAPASFDRIVITRETVKQKKITTTRETSFKVSGRKDKAGQLLHVNIAFMGALKPTLEQVPADYHDKDWSDFQIEKAQAEPDPKLGDKLGKLTFPASIPAEERLAVKIAIHSYFVNGTRNAEADAIIPIPNKANPVLYTLRFRPNNDVDVERIAEQGKDTAAGQVDPNRLDIAKSPEFADSAKDVKTLSGWLKLRYPRLKPTGTTVEELRKNTNKELEAKADQPDWFKNYDITILDDKQGQQRLRDVHKLAAGQVKDMKIFQPGELRFLEAVLETMTRKILAILKTVRMARQKLFIDREKDKTLTERPERAGTTFRIGINKTIAVYDRAFEEMGTQFLGGKSGVLPEEAETFVHELGHVVGYTGAEKKFNEFVKKKGIKPITRYAGEKPESEFFPEAFQLFQTDPEWMQTNLPDLFAWFDVLAKTGKPPAK